MLLPRQNGDMLQGKCPDMSQERLFLGFPKPCKYKMETCFRNDFSSILHRPSIILSFFNTVKSLTEINILLKKWVN